MTDEPQGIPINELFNHLRSHAEFSHMEHEAKSHEIWRFFSQEATRDQLKMMDYLIGDVSKNNQLGAYYLGMLSAIEFYRFNICPACDNDHDQILKETSSADDPTESEIIAEFKKYNLAPQHGGDDAVTFDTPGICMGCYQHYVSLTDRMLRPPGPDGCGGCQQKAGWG